MLPVQCEQDADYKEHLFVEELPVVFVIPRKALKKFSEVLTGHQSPGQLRQYEGVIGVKCRSEVLLQAVSESFGHLCIDLVPS